jgi:tetratricopeptide (TPR) repeat protein
VTASTSDQDGNSPPSTPQRLQDFYRGGFDRYNGKSFELRYAGSNRVQPTFDDDALSDIDEWMEDAGYGSDITWTTEGGEYQTRYPFATLRGDSEFIEKYLLAVDTGDEQCAVFVWTEGSFFMLFKSLDEFLQALEGDDPIVKYAEIFERAEVFSGDKAYEACIALLEPALHQIKLGEDDDLNFKRSVSNGHTLVGYCYFQRKQLENAEAAYDRAFALENQAAGGNLARLYFWEYADYERTLQHLDVYYKIEFGADGLENIAKLRLLCRVMLGQSAEAVALLGLKPGTDGALAPKLAISALTNLREKIPAGNHIALIDELLQAATRLAAPRIFASDRAWWDSLDEFWRLYFADNLKMGSDASPTDKQLNTLVAIDTLVVKAGIKRPGSTKRFDRLYPATLEPLGYLKSLTSIEVTLQTRWQLNPLSACTELESLTLETSRVNDLGPLAGLRKLKRLNIKSSEVEDLVPLASCLALKVLDLWSAPVESLEPLADCTELTELIAGNIPATHLPLFPKLKKLRKLDLSFSKISKAEVDEFKKLHPKCTVEHSPKKR